MLFGSYQAIFWFFSFLLIFFLDDIESSSLKKFFSFLINTSYLFLFFYLKPGTGFLDYYFLGSVFLVTLVHDFKSIKFKGWYTLKVESLLGLSLLLSSNLLILSLGLVVLCKNLILGRLYTKTISVVHYFLLTVLVFSFVVNIWTGHSGVEELQSIFKSTPILGAYAFYIMFAVLFVSQALTKIEDSLAFWSFATIFYLFFNHLFFKLNIDVLKSDNLTYLCYVTFILFNLLALYRGERAISLNQKLRQLSLCTASLTTLGFAFSLSYKDLMVPLLSALFALGLFYELLDKRRLAYLIGLIQISFISSLLILPWYISGKNALSRLSMGGEGVFVFSLVLILGLIFRLDFLSFVQLNSSRFLKGSKAS